MLTQIAVSWVEPPAQLCFPAGNLCLAIFSMYQVLLLCRNLQTLYWLIAGQAVVKQP